MGATELLRPSEDLRSVFDETSGVTAQDLRQDVRVNADPSRFGELSSRLFLLGSCHTVAFLGAGDTKPLRKVVTAFAEYLNRTGVPTAALDEHLQPLCLPQNVSPAGFQAKVALAAESGRDAATPAELLALLRAEPFRVLVACGSLRRADLLLARAKETDGVVFLTTAGRTSTRELTRAVQVVENAQSRLLGCVLVGREYTVPDFFYKRWVR